ncbi:glycosyltransferase [Paenarthrobacter nicotinovorans]|uniref:glycosyltransferase n=1 Tax=Paenarthrobacter nicotinovorans TaxID=29320 RepID=UPI0037FE028A
MRVLQVCTLITPDAAYGGPVRVAVNQSRALIEAGHDVTLLAGANGFGKNLPTEYDGVPVKLFQAHQAIPKTGFAGLLSPGLTSYLLRHPKPDVVHVHLARDLITLPTAMWARLGRIPYVLQTHGMIDPSRHPLTIPLDMFLTRPSLSGAEKVLYLTEVEKLGLEEVARNKIRLEKLENGVPLPSRPIPSPGTDTDMVEVLYLARLHPRKRPLSFVAMAKSLSVKYPHATFRLVGPDEGEAKATVSAIQAAARGDALSWEGSIAPELALQRMSKASVYVLPSVNEPFPMSVLEAMSLGKPVVITDSCGLAEAVRDSGAGLVVDDTQEALDTAVGSILADDSRRLRMGQNAYRLAHEQFSMKPVLDSLTRTYQAALRTRTLDTV